MRSLFPQFFPPRPWRLLALAAICVAGACPGWVRAAEGGAPVGYLRTRYQKFSVLLIPAKPVERPDGAPPTLTVEAVDGRAAIAPGEYYISNWKVEGDDAYGHHWYAKGNMLPDPVTIRAGEETRVRLADPLQAHLLIYPQQNPIGFRLELTGSYGERCREIRVDDHYIEHPKLDILDEKNRLVERITFEGRCGGTCLTLWPASPSLKGRFTALPSIELGPIPVEVGAGTSFSLEAAHVTLPKAGVGQPAPDFVLTASDATMAQLSFCHGRPVVLGFFCSCPLCKAVATELGRRPELAKRARLFAIFSDTAFADPAVTRPFLDETRYPGKLLLDLGGSAALQYLAPECPRLWVIDAGGIARHATPDHAAPAAKIVDDVVRALGK